MLAVRLWNTMGGQIDWAAFPLLVEIHEIDDIEMMIEQLVIIREAKNG